MYRVDETKYKGLESYTGSNLALPYVSLLASVELYQVAYFVPTNSICWMILFSHIRYDFEPASSSSSLLSIYREK